MAAQTQFLSLGDDVEELLKAEGGEVIQHDGSFWVQFPLHTKEIRDQGRFERELAILDNWQEACANVPPYAWELPSGKTMEHNNPGFLILCQPN